jgi:hypothetical protein
MDGRTWLLYVLMAGICWGTYVPMIAFGGRNLGSRYVAFLCVGIAYVLIAVLVPLIRIVMGLDAIKWDKPAGLTFATLAGVAGALGALGVIFASAAASKGDQIYIAPLIFGLAPVINTIVSLLWHPDLKTGSVFNFHLPEAMPGWKLLLGIVLVGVGAGLVLFAKEETEKPTSPTPTAAVMPAEKPPT